MSKRRPAPSAVSPTVAELLTTLDRIAPFSGAADWDNVGLLAGSMTWPARRALLAIDLTDAVARDALRRGVDAVVAYHPPIFKGIRRITDRAEAPTGLLPELLAARISILSVHTALDAAVGGTNDVLLDVFDTTSRRPLESTVADAREFKLVVFVPAADVEALRAALAAAGAGVIGNYDECSFESPGHGSFRGDDSTNPAVGRRSVLERVPEVRLEMVVPAAALPNAIRTVYANHRYEEPAFDVYPLRKFSGRGQTGMGRVGVLRRSTPGLVLLERLRTIADLSTATVVGSLRKRFSSVTTAAGSFGVRAFTDPASLVITGEMKHHDGLELLRRGVTSIVVGHYASERPALERLAGRLRDCLTRSRFEVSKQDQAPFQPLANG